MAWWGNLRSTYTLAGFQSGQMDDTGTVSQVPYTATWCHRGHFVLHRV